MESGCLLFTFLWGRGQWFSLKFSLSQENDDVPKSLDGQGTQAMNLVQRLCSVTDSSDPRHKEVFASAALSCMGKGVGRGGVRREGGG